MEVQILSPAPNLKDCKSMTYNPFFICVDRFDRAVIMLADGWCGRIVVFYGILWWEMAINKLPNIKIYKDRDSYRVKWWVEQTPYAIIFPNKLEATLAIAKIKLAMSGSQPWPPELLKKSSVQKFLKSHLISKSSDGQSIVEEYIEVITGEVTKGWVRFSKMCLDDLNKIGALQEITVSEAQKYISKIGQEQSISTRNKKLLIIKKFYNWAVATHFWPLNPFADIKKLRAVKINSDIHYLSRSEREVVLEKALTKKYGLAVWICLYTGMRRSEAFSLRWADINFETETIIAQSKGGATRTIPLAAPLFEKLQEYRKESGMVIESDSTFVDASRWLIDYLRAQCEPDINRKCIGWNPFRHTFCTLLAQSGVSLDKISMWAGHSPTICKRYYARFIPKDQRDTDIDRL